jgi:hypothetical protein
VTRSSPANRSRASPSIACEASSAITRPRGRRASSVAVT